MQDEELIGLYVARSEQAIAATSEKYGSYCHTIAYQILHNMEDSEECVNDTYWKTWKAIPPAIPRQLKAFLGKITRNLALHRWEKHHAAKRGNQQIALVLEELQECIPSTEDVAQQAEDAEVIAFLNRFLETLSAETRKIFVRRYWYCNSIAGIAKIYGISESKGKMSLFRTRKKLKEYLEKEGIVL